MMMMGWTKWCSAASASSLWWLLLLSPTFQVVQADLALHTTSTHHRIAFVSKRITSPYFEVSHQGCVDAAAYLGGTTCNYYGPDEVDAEGQARIVMDLIDNDEMEGLAVSVIDAEVMNPVIAHAVANDIPVVTFDSDAPDSARSAYIGTNNTFFGVQLGKVLKQLVPEGGTYAIVSAQDVNILEREAGFRSSLQDDDKWIEVATSPSYMQGNDTLAMEQIEEFGRLYEPTAIIPLLGAPMRSPQWKPFVSAHRTITMVVADGMPNQLELLAQNYAAGLVGQKQYEMGHLAVETLLDLLAGKSVASFIGTNLLEHTNIPLVLPDLAVDQNLIGNLRYVGFILFGLVLVTATAFATWMWCHRTVRVVRIAQPMFLMIIAVGVVIMASAMIPLGLDDDSSSSSMSAVCMSKPWLGVLGFTLTFSALFAKTWRVKQIFSYAQSTGQQQPKPTERQALKPFLVLLTINIVVLTLWTILDPLTYVRVDHEGTDGWNRIVSTYGSCRSTNPVPYVVPLAVINMGVLLLGNWQAYQTRKIRSEFSESKFILLSMASLLQTSLTGIPILFVVRENPQAYYLILVFMDFVICSVILVLMFVPKIAFCLATKDLDQSEQNRLIQLRIQDSVDACGGSSTRSLSSSVRRMRKDTSKLSSDEFSVVIDQPFSSSTRLESVVEEAKEEAAAAFDEQQPISIMDAECAYARRKSSIATYAGFASGVEKGRLSHHQGLSSSPKTTNGKQVRTSLPGAQSIGPDGAVVDEESMAVAATPTVHSSASSKMQEENCKDPMPERRFDGALQNEATMGTHNNSTGAIVGTAVGADGKMHTGASSDGIVNGMDSSGQDDDAMMKQRYMAAMLASRLSLSSSSQSMEEAGVSSLAPPELSSAVSGPLDASSGDRTSTRRTFRRTKSDRPAPKRVTSGRRLGGQGKSRLAPVVGGESVPGAFSVKPSSRRLAEVQDNISNDMSSNSGEESPPGSTKEDKNDGETLKRQYQAAMLTAADGSSSELGLELAQPNLHHHHLDGIAPGDMAGGRPKDE